MTIILRKTDMIPPVRCPVCDAEIPQDARRCPACSAVLARVTDEDQHDTKHLQRRPRSSPGNSSRTTHFPSAAKAVLQFLPSGTCIVLDMDKPVILGRQMDRSPEGLDLSEFKVAQHGVSRQHCLLRRHQNELIVCDLESTNGTMLNGEVLMPNYDYVVAEGDRLIMGTLHLRISYKMPDDDQ